MLNREKERHVPIQQIEGNCFAPEVPSKSKSLKIYICTQAIKNLPNSTCTLHKTKNRNI
jgi:hypothetical protein